MHRETFAKVFYATKEKLSGILAWLNEPYKTLGGEMLTCVVVICSNNDFSVFRESNAVT